MSQRQTQENGERARHGPDDRPAGDLRTQYPRVHVFHFFPYGPDIVIRFVESEKDFPYGQHFLTGRNSVYHMLWPGASENGELTPACRAHLLEFVRDAVRGRNRVCLHFSAGDSVFIDRDGTIRPNEGEGKKEERMEEGHQVTAEEREQLERAYRHTSFVVRDGGGDVTIRVGERSEGLDAILARHGVSEWAFVTAFNPRSRRLGAGENRARQEILARKIQAGGYRSLPGIGVGVEGDWEPEESLLVLGIDRARAEALGRAFEQNAVVFGTEGGQAELVWC